jgi:hypothetical protein
MKKKYSEIRPLFSLYTVTFLLVICISCSKSSLPKPAPVIANSSATVKGTLTINGGITTTDSLFGQYTGVSNGIQYGVVAYVPGRHDSISVSVVFNTIPVKDSTYKCSGNIGANSVILRTIASDTIDHNIGSFLVMNAGQNFTVKIISATQYTISFSNVAFSDSFTDPNTNKPYSLNLTASCTMNITDKY